PSTNRKRQSSAPDQKWAARQRRLYASKRCSADCHHDPEPRKSGAEKMRPPRAERNKGRHGKRRTASSNTDVCYQGLDSRPARYSSTQKGDGGATKSGSQK